MDSRIINNTKYEEALVSNDSELIYTNIVNIVNEEFDKVTKLKKIKINTDKVNNSEKIKEAIENRDVAYKTYKNLIIQKIKLISKI